MGHEETFIIHKIWDELSQINMHKINRVCQHNIQIGLVGSTAAIEDMMKWLVSFPYHNFTFPVPDNDEIHSNKEMLKRLIIIPVSTEEEFDKEKLKTSDFCIVESRIANEVKQFHTEVYPFDAADPNLAAQILANHERIRFALSHNFPVFRPEHAKIEIQETAIQNTAWVLISTLPAYLPVPHRTIVAPLEMLADFIVLTLNEVKLMFELIGLLGEKIELRHILDFAVVFGLAKLSRGIAVLILRSIPAHAAVLAKAALAYALTWAIGEAIVFFIVGRQRCNLSFLMQRVRHHFKNGLKEAQALMKKKALAERAKAEG